MAPIKRPKPPPRRIYLREWRLRAGYSSVEAAAKKIGYNHSTLQRLEKGDTPWNCDHLAALADLYGCLPHELVSRHPDGATSIRSEVFALFQMAPPDVQRQVQDVALAMLKSALNKK